MPCGPVAYMLTCTVRLTPVVSCADNYNLEFHKIKTDIFCWYVQCIRIHNPAPDVIGNKNPQTSQETGLAGFIDS